MSFEPNSEGLDWTMIEKLREAGDKAFIKNLYDSYFTDAAQQVRKISTALDEANHDAVAMLVHGVVGVSSNLGAERRGRAMPPAGDAHPVTATAGG